MQKRFLRFITIIIVSTLFAGIIYIAASKRTLVTPTASASKNSGSENKSLAEEFYKDTLIRSYASERDYDFLKADKENTSEDLPWVHSKNSISVNITRGRILFNRGEDVSVPIASLTKIMTAIVALEHKELSDQVTISENAARTGENSMGVSKGEVYSLEELLYGLILHSGNDAAVAIAEGVAGSEGAFTLWMNLKAEELGLSSTKFADSSGLDDGNISSAYDLARLSRYALKNPDFKKIVGTVDYEIGYSEGKHKYLALSNQTNLLTTYPGVKGIKTGYTEASKLTLVTYAENEGQEILAIVLQSDARKSDMIQILDYSFEKLGIKISHPLLDY